MKSSKPDDHRDLMSLARAAMKSTEAGLATKIGYFQVGVYGLIPRPVEGIGTMGVTEGGVLYYDPEWVMNTSDDGDELVLLTTWVLVHEAMHVYLDHCTRIKHIAAQYPEQNQDEIRGLLNLAADFVINVLIRDMDGILPHGVYPEQFGLPRGLTMEEYFELLTKKKAGGQGRSNTTNDQGINEGESELEEASGCVQHDIAKGHCGGVAGNPGSNKQLEEQLDQELGRSEANRDSVRRRVEAAIREHIQAHGRGSVPSVFAEYIPVVPARTKISWQRKLRGIALKMLSAMESGGMDFSLSMPSKRSYARGMIRPGLVQYKPEIAFVLDTSGSMGPKQLISGIREIAGVMRSIGIDTAWFLEADAAVATKPKRVRVRDMERDIQVHGRGGTDFDPALEACMALKPRPDMIFYMTDGEGWVTYKPKVPVIWVITNNRITIPCNWGHKVLVED